MKKLLVLLVGTTILLTGCGNKNHKTTRETRDEWDERTTYWEDIQVEDIQVENIQVEDIQVEEIETEETYYVSDEYLEELEANSRRNYWAR